MVKPMLNVLEACHRLALIEGQKENTKTKKEKKAVWGNELPHKRGIVATGFAVVVGVVNVCSAFVLWDLFLARSMTLVGIVLIIGGGIFATHFLTGAVTDIYTPQHLVNIEHMKRLTISLKELGARNEETAIKLEMIRKFWYDKFRVNSLVEKGYVGRTDDGRLYLIREMET
jgi:hypothetical protein